MSQLKPKKQVIQPNIPKSAGTQRSEKTATNTTSWLDSTWIFLLPLIVTFLAFFPTFENGFVNWDDKENIIDNRWVQALTLENIKGIFTNDVIGNYNPLPILTFAIEKAIFGLDNLAVVIHTNNLLLHLLCVYLVFVLALEMGLKRSSAVLVALLFGIHPMRVESVAWATERKDVLFATFYFAALLNYVKYLKSANYTFLNKYLLISFGLFIMSLFSKVQAVSLPLSMLALDYYFRRPFKINLIVEKAHFFLGSLAMGLVNIYMLKNAQSLTGSVLNFSIFDRLIIAFHGFIVYVGKFIFPWQMVAIYPYPDKIPALFYATALLFIASVVGVWWAHRKGLVTVVFGWLFFFVNFIFVSQIVAAGQGFLADRFTYVAYFGFFFLIVGLSEGFKNQNTVRLGFAAYLVLCFFMTYAQVQVWKDGEILWTHQIESEQTSVRGWQNRGIWRRDNGQLENALSDFNMALSMQDDPTTFNSRGKALAEMGQFAPAVNDFTRAIKLKPDLLEAYANRGAAYGALNKMDSALIDFTTVLAKDSLQTNALLNRGMVYDVLGKIELSIQDFTKVIALDPLSKNAFLNRMQAYRKLNQFEKALADCDSYLNLKKDNPALWADRALIKRTMGKYAEALLDFNESIRLNPSNGAVYAERARCHFQMGNTALGRADAEKAMKLGGQQLVDPNWLK